MDSRRAESFSDGVFAVAITVLIFNLLPIGREALSYRVLASAWPQYAAYVVSFLTIGIMWMNHHTLFGHVRLIDRPLLVLNLLLLMGIVAIPFPTALVAEHLTGPDRAGGAAAAVVYGVIMIVISLCYNAIWEYLVRHAEALGSRSTRQMLRDAIPGFGSGTALSRIPRWSVGLLGYLTGVLLAAFVSAAAALAVYGGLAVWYLFNHLPEPAGADGPDDAAVAEAVTGPPG
ncbi:MAG TPA: TMEM175 family protein [Streptosporangiaceae bacterium]|nr:TMEM175 family protein [Streptosporangiaceae bacterium]